MNPDDQLAAFARDGNQEAFAQVMQAYAALVYGTAYRKTGDREMSEEISQTVFVITARKAAALVKRPGLGGWLHRTTLLECANVMRSQARYRQRLKTMADDMETVAPEDTNQLREVIDEGLDGLSETDREAVLWRFFEGREFHEIGSRLGKSAEAAQKQVRRALDKLRTVLQRQGVTVSTVALSGFLTPELTKAAPLSWQAPTLQTISSSTLASPLAIMFSAKSLLLTAMVIAGAMIPFGQQSSRLNARQVHLTELEDRYATTGSTAFTLTRTSNSDQLEGPKEEPLTLETLAAAVLRSNHELPSLYVDGPSWQSLQGRLRNRPVSEIRELIDSLETLQTLQTSGQVREELRKLLVQHCLIKSDPKGALDHAIKHGMPGGIFEEIMQSWATEDFQSAYDYLESQRDANALLRRRLDGKDPEAALLEGFGQGLAAADIDIAMKFVEENIDSPDAPAFVKGVGRKLAGEVVGKHVRSAIHQEVLPESDDHASFLNLAHKLPDQASRQEAFRDYASQMARSPMIQAAINTTRSLLDHPRFPQADRQETLLHAADNIGDDYDDYAFMLVHALSSKEQRGSNLAALAERFDTSHPDHLSGVLNPGEPAMRKLHDDAFASLIETLHSERGQTKRAKKFLRKIIDETRRADLKERLNQ